MYETIFLSLRSELDPDSRITILRSSEDPGLGEYLEWCGAFGSTHMEPDGNIFVKFHDVGGVEKLTWLEEFIHALQFLKYGDVSLSCDDHERKRRETEAASCILKNAKKLHLTPKEIDDCEENLDYHGMR